jgi:AAA-like domain
MRGTPRETAPVCYLEDGLTVGEEAAWSWARIPTESYDLLAYPQRCAVVEQAARTLDGLAGSECHLLIVPRPYSVDDWADRLDSPRRTPRPAPGWHEYLDRLRAYLTDGGLSQPEVFLPTLAEHVGARGLDRREVYLGVRLDTEGEAGWRDQLRRWLRRSDRLMGLEDPRPTAEQLDALRLRAERVLREVRAGHPRARPASASELRWLMRRQMWRGLADQPEPSRVPAWGGEVLALHEGVVVNGRRCLRLEQPGEPPVYVATLGVSHMPPHLEIPGGEWLYDHEALAFPVEASVRFLAVPPREAAARVEGRRHEAEDQAEHTAQAGAAVPRALQDTLAATEDIAHQLRTDRRPLIVCWPRLVVWASSERALNRRVDDLTSKFMDLGIHLERPTGDQLALLLESMPGDRLRVPVYRQEMPVTTLAGSLYVASSEVGDDVGPYVGISMVGGRHPVHLDPFLAASLDRSTGIAALGSPGSGKTTLAWLLAYASRLRGAAVAVSDPKRDSLGLAALRGLGRVEVIELAGDSAGMLDPFRIEDDHAGAAELAAELCRRFLPAALAREVEALLMVAAGAEASEGGSPSLMGVIARLARAQHAQARVAAESLEMVATQPLGRLCFSSGAAPRLRLEDSMTIFQFADLVLPEPTTRPEDYSGGERLASGLVYALTRLLGRLMQTGSSAVPKLLVLDEFWILANSSQGRDLANRTLRLGRSRNTGIVLATQASADLLDERIRNNLTSIFAFRSNDEHEVANELRLLGIEPTQDLIAQVQRFDSGECLLRDLHGRLGHVQVDRVLRELAEAFDTTPRMGAATPEELR